MAHHCGIEETLERNGLRKTRDRHLIMALFSSSGRTWSASQLHKELRIADLSTVYRNVKALTEKGLLRRTHLHEDEAYYELAGLPHHDHLHCDKCAAVECIPCPVKRLETHFLELRGLCSSCG